MNLAIAMIIAYIPFFYGVYKQAKDDLKEEGNRNAKGSIRTDSWYGN